MVFETLIEIKKDEIPKMTEICDDVIKKDSTFLFRVEKPEGTLKQFLIVSSETEKQAHRRGIWLRARLREHFGVKGLVYDVRRA